MALIRGMSRSSQGLLIATLMLLGLGALPFLQTPPQPDPAGYRPPAFDLQAHRGYRGRYPENTLPAIEAALAAGVTTLELDLQLTADGYLVVHHDPRLSTERTRARDGAWLDAPGPPIREMTLKDLQSYDVGSARPESRTAQRFPEQAGLESVRVPTLDETVDLAERLSGGEILYNLETKIAPGDPASADPAKMVRALLALLERKGIGQRTTIQSFDWRSLELVEESEADIPTVYLTAERSWLNNVQRGRPGASPWTAGLDIDAFDGSVPRAIVQAGGAVWSPYYRDLRPAELHEAHRLGLRVVVWTVNDPADMASLIELGVDGIITDYPGRLRRVLEDEDKPLPPRYPATD
ncbi:MAG: glycerophosphodiester phosphodiesterase [Rhodovibrionaceae bacterium]|nr:glycerophosphodiester phosphodiesterase [Rhodovibrionaceae bacterium]